MIFKDTVSISLRGLRSHKLRSVLTMLGLIIGVVSVIVLSAFGTGLSNSVTSTVSTVASTLTIVPQKATTLGGSASRSLTNEDATDIAAIPEIKTMVPVVNGSTTGGAGQQSTSVTASAGGVSFLSSTVSGTTTDFLTAKQITLTAGRFFNQSEQDAGAKVVVLGPTVAHALYGEDANAAIGQKLRINKYANFKVIGVLSSFGADSDSIIVMPIKCARSAVFGFGTGGDEVSQINALASSTANVATAKEKITTILRANHHIKDPAYDDFQIQDLGSRVNTFTNLVNLITGAVPVVAAISLLVGGIGILNIMLVSVTDRTREIGTRKAIGASDYAILGQFGLEAVTLAAFGGLIGVIFGYSIVIGAKQLLPLLSSSSGIFASFSPVLSAKPAALAFLTTLLIGIVAGGYPAWRAAQLEPIEALRYE